MVSSSTDKYHTGLHILGKLKGHKEIDGELWMKL